MHSRSPVPEKEPSKTPNPVHLVLNGAPVSIAHADPNRTLLDFLRLDAGLNGTKEGCAEGDCGACIVALARRDTNASVHWTAINSCIRLLSSVDGCAITTVDSLAAANGPLHPVQQAMVDADGSQCGFCTPGFVMSLFVLGQTTRTGQISREAAGRALSGNLCRCTGYRPIVDAAMQMRPDPAAQSVANASLATLLDALPGAANGPSMRPDTIAALLQMRAQHPQAQLIAGCTDVGLWITKAHRRFARTIDVTFVTELDVISQMSDGVVRIGAAVSLTRAFQTLDELWPQLRQFTGRFASLPVCNSGTLGGNLANGSPIGDSIALLLALGTTLTVASVRGERRIALADFYEGRQQNRLAADEVLLWIDIDGPQANESVFAYKVSKRFDQDISTVCFAMRFALDNADMVSNARIGVGGMAATARLAESTQALLSGQIWSAQTVDKAATAIRAEFSPISDMRATQAYRTQVIGSLLIRAWRESQGQTVLLDQLDPERIA